MIKQDFSMTDADFRARKDEGLEQVRLNRPVGLEPRHRARFEEMVGVQNVQSDDYSRVRNASGKTTEEMLELRHAVVESAADLVIHPRNKRDVRQIVAYCHEHAIPIYAFGAGSSVNFGVRPVQGGISLVLSTQ
jgi:alkyldihydroxyacetonephosphate synthase